MKINDFCQESNGSETQNVSQNQKRNEHHRSHEVRRTNYTTGTPRNEKTKRRKSEGTGERGATLGGEPAHEYTPLRTVGGTPEKARLILVVRYSRAVRHVA